jgi:hypothetical protein
MAYHDDLLQQAVDLVSKDTADQTQADLRRSEGPYRPVWSSTEALDEVTRAYDAVAAWHFWSSACSNSQRFR